MGDALFDSGKLLAEARAKTGLENFGNQHFMVGLELLLESFDRNLANAQARMKCRHTLLTRLVTRLKMQAAFEQHPEILQQDIVAPMIVTGLPRTGTSALVNLLACDPASKPLLLWEIHCPEPLEGLPAGAPDPRHVGMVQHMEANRNPEFDKIHYAHPDLPEECVMMHAYSFDGVQTGYEVIMLEPYASWFQNHSLKPLYTEFRDQLKLLQWQRPGERWLLKAPAHMWALDDIIELFPDARLVWGHRDPVSVTSSICSMTHLIMGMYMHEGDMSQVDPASIGEKVMDFYATSLERGLASRAKLSPAQVTDFSHAGLIDDAMTTAEAIYAHFNMHMTPAIRSALQAYVDAHPQHEHGAHRHQLAQFGLTEERVRERFAFYLKDNAWL